MILRIFATKTVFVPKALKQNSSKMVKLPNFKIRFLSNYLGKKLQQWCVWKPQTHNFHSCNSRASTSIYDHFPNMCGIEGIIIPKIAILPVLGNKEILIKS